MKRIKSAALISAVIIMCMLSGCVTMGIGGENIMSPPGEGAERSKITALLQSACGSDMVLFYPKTGANRSAISAVSNFSSDNLADAIAFCSPSESGNVTVFFISKKSGKYEIVSKFEKNYSIVDRVYFADMNSDGKTEVIVGFGSPINLTSNICIYSFNDNAGAVKEIDLVQSYSEMSVGDYLANGENEIFVLTLPETKAADNETPKAIPSYATLYGYNGRDSVCLSSAVMDSSAVTFPRVTAGRTESGSTLCIVDCLRADNLMFTQIVYWNAAASAVEVYPSASGNVSVNETARNSAVFSKDANADGLIEIPSSYTILSLGEEPSAAKNSAYTFVSWNRFDKENSKLLVVSREYINYEYGYSVKIPIEWDGKVIYSLKDGEFSLYEWNSEENKAEKLIFKITSASAEVQVPGETLYSDSQKRHVAQIGNSDNIRIDMQTLKELFSINT